MFKLTIKLFLKSNDTEKYNFFKGLIDIRTQLKKEKNPMQTIYKIIILSVTGQFNLPSSNVYDPLMYFSMTANGQLMIIEILLKLEEKGLITKLLGCNTDGFTLKIKRSNLDIFKEVIQDYQTQFGIMFDTFDLIHSMIIFNVNTYIARYENNNIKDLLLASLNVID